MMLEFRLYPTVVWNSLAWQKMADPICAAYSGDADAAESCCLQVNIEPVIRQGDNCECQYVP